jgi:hypothetical protein
VTHRRKEGVNWDGGGRGENFRQIEVFFGWIGMVGRGAGTGAWGGEGMDLLNQGRRRRAKECSGKRGREAVGLGWVHLNTSGTWPLPRRWIDVGSR